MKRIVPFFLMLVFCFSAFSQVDTSKSNFWMMTYFINGQDNAGTRLAFSSDTTGNQWQKYNNEAAVIVPITVTGANDSRMRDPMIAYDSLNRRFNLVWTVSWTGKVIGWDTSSLLKSGTWGPQVGLAISNNITNSSFSWAPEILWDDLKNQWMIYWSVAVSGTNTRVYYSMITGTDFRNFGTPQVLLNTGYDIIDADIIKVGAGNYQMFFKDERTGYKYIRRASGATTPQGPYGTISSVVANATTEGPSVVKQGNEYHIFVDHYSNQGVGIAKSKNIDTALSPWPETWTTFGTGSARLVVSHCNVIAVPKMLVKWMLYNDSAWVRFVRTSTAVRDCKYVPVNPSNERDNAATFDLLGKIVATRQPADRSTTALGPNAARRLPPGFHINKGKTGAGVTISQPQ